MLNHLPAHSDPRKCSCGINFDVVSCRFAMMYDLKMHACFDNMIITKAVKLLKMVLRCYSCGIIIGKHLPDTNHQTLCE